MVTSGANKIRKIDTRREAEEVAEEAAEQGKQEVKKSWLKRRS
jgi:hypothetical protein